MNDLYLQEQKSLPKHNKKRLTQEQLRLLEASFNPNKRLEPESKFRLACQLSLPPRQVAIWYQNKRARWKAQSLELDHNDLRRQLDKALEENRRLEKDVKRLEEELERAQQVFLSLNQPNRSGSTLSSSSCDEGGISSLHWETDDAMQFEEIYYASMWGTNRSNWD